MVPDPAIDYVTARVVGDPGGAFVRTVLINAGERNGDEKGQAAITGEGLAGRAAEDGQRSACLLPLTARNQIGIASWREQVCTYGLNEMEAVSLQKRDTKRLR